MFYQYKDWGFFMLIGLLVIIGFLFIIGVGGPWYHQCDISDCSEMYNYKIYCEDNCWRGNYGLGDNTFLFGLVAICVLFVLPWLWTPVQGRTTRKDFNINGMNQNVVSP